MTVAAAIPVAAQQPEATPQVNPSASPAEKPKEAKPVKFDPKTAQENMAADQIVEIVILAYGGREVMNQIRKTARESGKMSVQNAEGKMDSATYQRWTMRAPTMDKEKVRLEQDFATARYSLVLRDAKIFGIYNDSVFTPREDASKAFENQIVHSIEALLRYKENGSTLSLGGKDKRLGVEYNIIDLTDSAGRKTRYFISAKLWRVAALEYEDAGRKFRRQFYDYNFAQGTLVPHRTVLYEGDKVIEESEIGTITFGQKVDDGLFPEG
jgi:hypothetical protein